MNRRRSRQRGQVIPILALILVVLAGFAALTIDAGVSYDQSRNDQDVSDSAALAASYNLFGGGSLSTAYAAAANVASDDCNGPEAPCAVTVNFYASSYTGSPACSWSASTNNCSGVSASSVSYVGTTVGTTSHDYFANLTASSRSHTVQSQAVAQVSSTGGGGGGGTSPNPTADCEICIFGNATFNSSSDILEAAAGNIDIGGYILFDSSSDAVETASGSGWGIEVIGGAKYNGATVAYYGSSSKLEASGSLSIDGNILFDSSSNSILTDTGAKANLDISGTVTNNGSSNSISPSAYGTTAAPAFTDPLASTALPTYSGASAPTYSGLTNYGNWSYPTSPCTGSDTINPGIYDSITINCSSATLNFNPGLYVIAGGQVNVNSSSDTLASPSSGVTFYYTCASGGAPASCGTFSSTTDTCSSTSSGAEIVVNGSSSAIDLSAGSGGSNILFFYDRCNSNQDAFYGQSSSMNYTGSGTLYAHSGGLWFDGSSAGVPGPLVADNVVFDSSSVTVGTSSGSINLGSSTSSSPGNLVK